MWEESCESIRVRYRQVGDVPGDGEESDDEFVVVETGNTISTWVELIKNCRLTGTCFIARPRVD